MATKKAEAPAPKEKAEMKLPWWGKVLVGALGGFVLVKYTPILECLTMFFYVCMVPLLLLSCVGLVSDGMIKGMSEGWRNTVEEINTRVSEKVRSVA